jgi:hypothetical protein
VNWSLPTSGIEILTCTCVMCHTWYMWGIRQSQGVYLSMIADDKIYFDIRGGDFAWGHIILVGEGRLCYFENTTFVFSESIAKHNWILISHLLKSLGFKAKFSLPLVSDIITRNKHVRVYRNKENAGLLHVQNYLYSEGGACGMKWGKERRWSLGKYRLRLYDTIKTDV